MNQPKHAYEIVIKIGCHDLDFAIRTLRELIMNRFETSPQLSASPSGVYEVNIQQRDVTREQYHAELNAWLERANVSDGTNNNEH